MAAICKAKLKSRFHCIWLQHLHHQPWNLLDLVPTYMTRSQKQLGQSEIPRQHGALHWSIKDDRVVLLGAETMESILVGCEEGDIPVGNEGLFTHHGLLCCRAARWP